MNLKNKTKYGIKFILAGILYYSGVLFLIKSVKLKNSAVVLMYHRVLTEQEKQSSFSHPGIIVCKDTFAKQMAYLKKMFHVISEEEFISHITQGTPFKNNSCLITFDDGWMDNYTHAYPILSKLNLPATIFLTTDYIGTGKKFWQEKLAARLFSIYLQEDDQARSVLSRYELEEIIDIPPSEAKRTIRKFITQMKERSSPDIREIMAYFLNENGDASAIPNDMDVFFNWEQAREMAQNGMSFGSHSVHHHILTQIPLDDVDREIAASRKYIADCIGISPKSFCYPNGNYSEEIAQLVAKNEYLAAFSTTTGSISNVSNHYALPRINIHNEVTDTIPLFMARVLGLF